MIKPRRLLIILLLSFVLTNVLCVIDYETVSLRESWSHSTTRNELVIITGFLFVVGVILELGYAYLVKRRRRNVHAEG